MAGCSKLLSDEEEEFVFVLIILSRIKSSNGVCFGIGPIRLFIDLRLKSFIRRIVSDSEGLS